MNDGGRYDLGLVAHKYKKEKVNHNHFVEDDVAVKKKAKVVILDNNPLSVSCYMDEHPETFKKMELKQKK